MKNTYLIILFILLIFSSAPLWAQQSSKSKSKERFREKEAAGGQVDIQNVTRLNSKSRDYGPVFYRNGLVFASNYKKNGAQNQRTGETFSELYFAPFDPNGIPANRQMFSIDINSKLNEGPATFSRDNKTMFYTQNNQKGGVQKADRSGVVRLKIYEAHRGPVDWIPQGELPFNDNSYSCLHPSLSADGKRLYFASDMPGGEGGYDIYYSDRLPEGGWTAPVNVGPPVNTPKSEITPFIHPNGTLFFASNGHDTNLGGLDIFYLEEKSGERTAVNMDAPYNSKEDDFGFIIDDELRHGFFSSDRAPDDRGLNGTVGKDDIWMFKVQSGIQEVKPASLRGAIVVKDARTGRPIQGAELRLLKSTGEGFVDTDSSVYEIDLQPVNGDPSNLSLQLRPKSAQKMRPAEMTSNSDGEALADFLRFRSYVLLVNHPDYQMTQQFVSVPDTDEPFSVQIQMTEAPKCHRAQGTVLTDQLGTRIANASVKFIHKATNKTFTTRTSLNGDYDICLTEPGEYLVQVSRTGFGPDNHILYALPDQAVFHETRLRPTRIGVEPSEAVAVASGLEPGAMIALDNIVFDYNQATLNQTAIRSLDALYDLMTRYPDLNIDLVAHTDTRGNAANNLALSKERAENAVSYLEYRGIPLHRMRAIGRGGAEPRNHCNPGVDCSETEHAANVRVEVRVRK